MNLVKAGYLWGATYSFRDITLGIFIFIDGERTSDSYSEIILTEFTNNKVSMKTDKFTSYFTKASIYLYPLQMIGHPYFICKINTTNEILNQYHNYDDGLLNQTQLKLRYSEKIIIMNRVIHNLLDFYSTNIEEVISYLLSLYYMFTNNRLLHSYPLAVDINNNLCRFE